MPDNPYVAAGLIAVLLLSLSWHEAAHAWVADRLGDPTPRAMGRVTLNPLRHLDPFLSVVLPVITFMIAGLIFGGGKPVPVDVRRFEPHARARNFMLVALAGPLSNLLLAALFALAFVAAARAEWIPPVVTEWSSSARVDVHPPSLASTGAELAEGLAPVLEETLAYGVLINILLAVFNLMPIPPLDGSRVVGWLLPDGVKGSWYRLDRFGLLLILVAFFGFGLSEHVFGAMAYLFERYVSVTDWMIALSAGGGA